MPFGANDEVVSTGFGANDQVVSGFGSGDTPVEQGSVHPSKMSDDQIALDLMKIDPSRWDRFKQSRLYKNSGGLGGLFTDPDGYWGSYIVGKNRDTLGTGLNRGVQSLAAGVNRAKLAGGQLVGQLLAKALGSDEQNTWSEIQLKANEINQNINQGRAPNQGGFDPANIIGQGLTGASLIRGNPTGSLPTRLANQSAIAATESAITTPGGNSDRAKSATIAGLVTPAIGAAGAGAKRLLEKAKGKAWTLGNTPSVKETLNELSDRMGGQDPGEALQAAANEKYNAAWGEARQAYAPVDAVKGGVSVDLAPGVQKLDEIIATADRGLSPVHPAQLQLLKEIRERAARAGSAPMEDVMTLVSDLGKNLNSLQRQHGPMIDREAFEGVKNAFIDAMSQADSVASQDLSAANSVFAQKVGPLIRNKKLVEIRDTDKPGDILRGLAQGPLRNVKPQAAAEIAQGSSPDPLLYQFYENAMNQAGGRPGGFIPSANKVLPAVDMMDPQIADILRRQIAVAEASRGAGAVANYVGGKVLGTPATIAASFNPAISGPGGAWGALQSEGLRDSLARFGASPTTDDAWRAILLGNLFSRGGSQ